MRESLLKIKNGLGGMVRLARALPAFFRDPITLARAREEIEKGVARRGENFLELARTRIYADPASPYLRLLKIAGCEFSDLRAGVLAHGLEPTLTRLAGEGVYLTADEFKGKKEVVRGRERFRVAPEHFQLRETAPGLLIQTGGTTGKPVGSTASLERLAYSARALAIFLDAHDFFAASHALQDSVLPGSGGTSCLLTYVNVGVVPERWFARTAPSKNRLGAFYHYATMGLIVALGKLYGPGFPRPEFVPAEEIVPWILQQRARGKTCCVMTATSNAVRIARLAAEMGVSLEGAKFLATGEPLTDVKREIIVRSGAGVTCRYAFTELGVVAFGCGNPRFADEVHVHQNLATSVSHPTPVGAGEAIHPLLFTTVHPSADRLLLNVANGDYGVLEKRDCGCALEKAGLDLHLHGIRSYEKFTGEGMNYFYAELFELIEKALPAEFGGGVGDYQLVEEEDKNGQTRLTLRVDPRVGAVDREKLLARLRAELGRGSWGNEYQARIWDGAGTLRILREAPFAGAREKILPLQLQKRSE